MSEPHFGLAPPSSLLFLPPSCCVSPLPPHTIHLGHCPRRSPCQIFCAGCILSLLPLAFSAPHSLSLLLSSCAICLLPHLLLPLSHCPQTPFFTKETAAAAAMEKKLYACCVYLTPSPQAANSRRARKGGALSRDLAALSRTDLASQPRMDHLVLISQHHLAPISQSRSTILC